MNPPMESLLLPLTIEQQERLAVVLSDYLDRVDQGEPGDLESLLVSHPDLAHPLTEYVASLNMLQRATVAAGSAVVPASNLPPDERILGDYRLIREVGRGGMGVVYEARQLSLGRTVALKLLPFAAFFEQKQITRFQNEAQAAAGLHHPNIVSVFAVGCERGVHYYSMQFIDGQSLEEIIQGLRQETVNQPALESSWKRTTRFFERRRGKHLSVAGDEGETPTNSTISYDGREKSESLPASSKRRLECLARTAPNGSFSTLRSIRSRSYIRAAADLALQAADALHHAHQCGIVHRDVKPSNLLLDRFGKLWMTDFGLARCELGPDLTATGDLIGTLRYMSPEQAGAQPHLVDHRTDIYSLGATLFELLTLRPAFEGSDRTEILRRIKEEPVRSLRAINPAIPYDLETIVLKATSKSRDDRYSSAEEFREDLRRFLAGEPAEARRPNFVDRSLKWLARHRRTAAAAFFTTIVVLVGVTTALMVIARKQAETDQALARSRLHFSEIQRVVDRFGAGISEKLRDVPGADSVRGELLRETLAYYEAILAYAGDDPTLRRDAAKAIFKIGAVHEQIGENDQAITNYRLARTQFEELVAQNHRDRALIDELAICENNLGALQTRMGQVADGESILRSAVARLQVLEQDESENIRFREDSALARINLGLALAELGEIDAAEESYRAAVQCLSPEDSSPPTDVHLRIRLATAFHNLSGLVASENPFEAERFANKSVDLLRKAKIPKGQAALGLALSNLGALLSQRGRLDQAVTVFHEAIALQEKLVRDGGRIVSHRSDLASTRNNLGQTYLDRGDLGLAQAEFEESRKLFEQLVADSPTEPFHAGGLAGVLNNLGMVRERQGDYQGAVDVFQRAVTLQQNACDRAPRVERYRVYLDQHYANLIRVLETLGRGEEAEAMRDRKTTIRRT